MKSAKLHFANLAIGLLPATRGFAFKRALLRWAGLSIGEGARICSSARFFSSGSIAIGARAWIGHDVRVFGGDSAIEIGADVDLAPRVTLVGGSHEQGAPGQRAAGPGISAPIRIGDRSWIGAGAIVLGGVTVGQEAIVAAGAVVTHNVPDRTKVGGVPARALRSLGTGGTQ